ncbi:MAG: sigma-70 family RNA polymerase sigma factor [Propionibacteriaceae bacterium]|nr:sigma-70 family RNA polymerase sigma factor [Propionibacteriaceae bacterium]
MEKITAGELLNASEERELGLAIEAGVLAQAALDCGTFPAIAEAEELAELVRCGKAAWSQFLLANVRLVAMLASREARRNQLDTDELFQEGFVALAEALRKFDFRIGRFITFAFPRVRHQIAAAAFSRMGEVPPGLALQRAKVLKLGSALEQELGTSVVWEQACENLSLDSRRLQYLLSCRPALPLPQTETSWGGVAAESVDFDAGLEQQALLRSLAFLTEVEATVITLRFGLAGNPQLTLVAVAKRLGRSVSGIRRIEQIALSRLRGLLQERNEPLRLSA